MGLFFLASLVSLEANNWARIVQRGVLEIASLFDDRQTCLAGIKKQPKLSLPLNTQHGSFNQYWFQSAVHYIIGLLLELPFKILCVVKTFQ